MVKEGAVLKRNPGRAGKVALTFDDGPDPIYTPKILTLLARHRAKATFFLLSRKARRHPELVKAIIEEGHHVASHGLRHRPEITMSREGTFREMKQAADILAELTGEKPRYYRPPWGGMNRWTLETARRLGMQVVLWSCDSWDWIWGINPRIVTRRILTCPGLEGGVVLCHDGSFVPHRPRTILAALPEVLKQLQYDRGWSLVDLPDLFSRDLDLYCPHLLQL